MKQCWFWHQLLFPGMIISTLRGRKDGSMAASLQTGVGNWLLKPSLWRGVVSTTQRTFQANIRSQTKLGIAKTK